MPQSIPDQVLCAIGTVAGHYRRLVLVVGAPATGKTGALQVVADRAGAPRINLNLELSRRLLDLTTRQRAIQCPELLNETLAAFPGDTLLLDNIEILFDPTLQQDPLHHFQAASRNRTLVVAWPGGIRRDDRGQASLTYAIPGHPEYRRYPVTDLVLVESTATG
jgi:hypothetical protein